MISTISQRKRSRLVLEDGTVFRGYSYGAPVEAEGEVVFNTSHFGYQEILTDPSYRGQMVILTAPLIGNVGVTPLDAEATRPQPAALLVRNPSLEPSSWRATGSLENLLLEQGIPGQIEFDTRAVVRHLREKGTLRGILSASAASDAELIARARQVPSLEGIDLAREASCKQSSVYSEGAFGAPHVVAIDYGAKRSMFEELSRRGVRLTVLPSSASAGEILALRPDGVFLTNGPGDPAAVQGAQESIRGILGKVPIFGICLGHQLLALALGGRTFKMKFGHRGANQPVVESATGKVSITSQNHGYAVDAASLEGRAEVTHVNLNDGSVEGLANRELRVFSVQHHPEASPGPQDAVELFDRFVGRLEAGSFRDSSAR